MTTSPIDPAAGSTPVSHNAVREPASASPRSAAGKPPAANLRPPAAGGSTSSLPAGQRSPRRTEGGPRPGTGEADPGIHMHASPGRGRTQNPAGAGRRRAAGAVPAGSTGLSAGQMAIARAMKEDRGKGSLDYHVREILKELGLWGFHPLISIGSRKGWPDWTFIGKWIMYRELKSETGTLRPDQELVRDLIMAAGGDWALWRPSDYLSGRIARELTAISRLRVATA